MVPFSCCCNYATVSHIGMQIFNFLVLSVIIAYDSVLPRRIIHLMYVNSNQSKKMGAPYAWELEIQLLLQNLDIY